MKYKLVNHYSSGEIVGVNKITDNLITYIPFDETINHYQEYLQWLDDGNTPEEAQ